MPNRPRPQPHATPRDSSAVVRCAIYTRKSTDEGLDQEFNSLDAQREAGEAFVLSQRTEGWAVLPDRYDDGGFTGANVERPALRRLLADLEAGRVDCVVVYKVDRLSRSLLDFARLIETFERRRVSFVSVTQQFNTKSPAGRLMLNMLLAFAEFERGIISERTRDKVSAARRKGKWIGGVPVLGYDVDVTGGRLVVNEAESVRVRALFDLFLKHGSVMAVVEEANRRGWTTKQWTTRDGHLRAGKPLTKNLVFRTLTNVIYTGKVSHKGQVYPGEHMAIIDPGVWLKVEGQLRGNGLTGGRQVRNRYAALLKGVLWCAACQRPMVHTYSMKRNKRYRYYVCQTTQERGWEACPGKSVSAAAIEESVVGRIRSIVVCPEVTQAAATEVGHEWARRTHQLRSEMTAAERELRRLNVELASVVRRRARGSESSRLARTVELEREVAAQERHCLELHERWERAADGTIAEDEVKAVLRSFEPVWGVLSGEERSRIVQTLVQRVVYDGRTGEVTLTLQEAALVLLGRQAEAVM